ncbi:hypothetical protein LY78DRAFT_737214 [Colletotrichum sublineola]|nr:hypothetical protein LY78DRAFT_737214 [Colletotrichum sublineola]
MDAMTLMLQLPAASSSFLKGGWGMSRTEYLGSVEEEEGKEEEEDEEKEEEKEEGEEREKERKKESSTRDAQGFLSSPVDELKTCFFPPSLFPGCFPLVALATYLVFYLVV